MLEFVRLLAIETFIKGRSLPTKRWGNPIQILAFNGRVLIGSEFKLYTINLRR